MSLAVAGAVAPGAPAQNYTFHDDGEVALVAVPGGGVLEPPIALYYRGGRVDDPRTGGPDAYAIVELYDRVPDTGSYPLTGADIIANGLIRPLVQRADGMSSPFGTSIVTGPSFREQGLPLDLIPDMSRADVVTGDPHGDDRVTIQGQGFYGGKAILVCRRRWPDPAVGRTDVLVSYAWYAADDITLEGGANGRGLDAFRLAMLSSMLADTDEGLYDARYLRVVDPQDRARTIEVPDAPRSRHLFDRPRPVAPGGSFALLKDNGASWNPGSPSIEVVVESVSAPVGAIAVQAYLAGTVNPNDDSLSVWLEWVDAPPVIGAGTRLDVELRVVATPATDPGDLDHDGAHTRADGVLAFGLLGRAEADPDFDAYADLDRDGDIDDADFNALVAIIGAHPADTTRDGVVDTRDVIRFLGEFAGGGSGADLNADGAVNTLDAILYLNLFAYAT